MALQLRTWLPFRDWSLRTKLVVLLVATSLVPLALSAYVDLDDARKQRLHGLQELLQSRGDQIVRELDDFHRGYRRAADRVAIFSDVQALCAADRPPGGAAAKRVSLRSNVVGILNGYPASDSNIRGAALLDIEGRVLLATESAMNGLDLSGQAHIRQALAGERVISSVFVGGPESARQPTLAYLAPVLDADHRPACVAVLWVKADALWHAVRASNGLAGAGSFAVLFDAQGIRIAHSYNDDIVFHPAGALASATTAALVQEQRFGPATQALLDDVRAFPEQFERARAAAPSTAVFRGFAPVNQSWNYGVARRFSAVPWTVFYMVPEATFEAQLAPLTRDRFVFALLIMASAGALGLLFAAGILRPVRVLTRATRAIAGGDLSARAQIGQADELGQLARDFDSMANTVEVQAHKLSESRELLEIRVEQRTRELLETTEELRLQIANRKQTEAELLKRDAALRRAQTVAQLAHVITRPDGSFESWSETLPPLVGRSLEALPRSTRVWLELVHPEDREHFRRNSIAAGISGQRSELDYRAIRPDGRVVHIHQVNDPITTGIDADGRYHWFCTQQDVTAAHLAQAGLQESELRFRQMAESIDDVFWISTADFQQVIYLSPAYEKIWGRPREEVYQDVSNWRAHVHPGDQARVSAQMLAAAGAPAAYSREYRIVRPDGSIRWVVSKSFPILDGKGVAYRIAGLATDITDRKASDEARLRLAAIVQSSDDAIIGKTLHGIITSWNPGAEKLFGYRADEAVGQAMAMLIPAERRDEEVYILTRIARGETVEHFETVRTRKNGQLIDISATISPIFDAGGLVVGASKIARNITERKYQEARLQAQLQRLHLLDQITSAIGERQDLRSIHQVVLRSLEERLPVDFSCVLGVNGSGEALSILRVGAGSVARAEQMGLVERGLVQIDENGLSRCLRGELVHEPDLTASLFPFPSRLRAGGLHSLVLAPLRADDGVFGILVVARAQARTFSSGECEFVRQLSAHVALAAQQARLHEALQSAYDELRQTQQAVMQQERLRALGQMASGIAHDINNAISPVLLYTETLLEHEPGLSQRARSYLQTIARSVDDVAATVARLREFYRQREPGLPVLRVPLAPLIEQVLQLTRARWHDMPLQKGVVIHATSEVADDLPLVMGIESEIREALINLVFNAVDAMPEGGKLTLRARHQKTPQPGTVELAVIDTGCGMDEETRARCMEPFFTTKGERGTGLGLAMVYGVAQRHGAELHIDSVTGRGTALQLNFPVPTGAGAAPPVSRVAPPLRCLRLLLVDDDPIVLKSLQESLQADGHVVTTTDAGQKGLDAFHAACERGEPFDAVITDLGMPYVDGRQVAQAVKSRDAATPVILLTGWGQRLIAEEDLPFGVDRVLSKPPKLQELRSVLAALLAPSNKT